MSLGIFARREARGPDVDRLATLAENAPQVETGDSRTLAASLAYTNLRGSALAGYYRVSAAVTVTAAGSAGTLSCTVEYVDEGTTQTFVLLSGVNVAAANATALGSQPFYHAGGNIRFKVDIAGLSGTPTIKHRVWLEKLPV